MHKFSIPGDMLQMGFHNAGIKPVEHSKILQKEQILFYYVGSKSFCQGGEGQKHIYTIETETI